MTQQQTGTADSAYCVFCRSGSEHLAVASIRQNFPQIEVIAPVRKIPEKRQGQWREHDLILFPGYIFLYADGDLPHDLKRKSHHLYKILQYERGVRSLSGPDAEYAQWIRRHQGTIAPSRFLVVGSGIEVIDGPLQDCQGKIIRLDKHKRRVWVEFDFDGQKRIVSLGAECINPFQPEAVNTAETEK